MEFPWESTGASGMGVSTRLGSDLMTAGVDVTVETRRRGVDAETAFGSFLLCDRVPLLVRFGVDVPGAALTIGVVGVVEEGRAGVGRAEEF